MSEPIARKRKSSAPQPRKIIKTSCLLDVTQHARLSALASLRGVAISALIAEFVAEGVRSVLVIDKRSSADRGDLSSEEGSAN